MYRVAVVGVGGIGSHLIDHVNLLCGANELTGFSFTIYDPDTIEPKNLSYQRFEDHQIGMNKAEALYETKLNIPNLIAIPEKAEPRDLTSFDVVVICVDSGAWRSAFFKHQETNPNKFWIDLRSEGRTIAAYTSCKANTPEAMMATVVSAPVENASCQLPHELSKGIIQAGNRIVALIGVQYLLNIAHKEFSAPVFTQRF